MGLKMRGSFGERRRDDEIYLREHVGEMLARAQELDVEWHGRHAVLHHALQVAAAQRLVARVRIDNCLFFVFFCLVVVVGVT